MQSHTKQASRDTFVGALTVLAAAVTVSSKAVMVKLAYAYAEPFPVDASTLITLRMAFSAPFLLHWRFGRAHRLQRQKHQAKTLGQSLC